jgi:uncharacterized membrane protein
LAKKLEGLKERGKIQIALYVLVSKPPQVDTTSSSFTQIVKLINEPTNNRAVLSNVFLVILVEGIIVTDQIAWGLVDTIQNAAKPTQ